MGMQTKERIFTSRTHRHAVLQEVEGRGSLPDYFRRGRQQTDQEAWKLDESWTSIIGYIAEMSLPGEG